MDKNEARSKIQSCINDILKIASKLPPSELASLIGSSIAPAKSKPAEAAETKPAKAAKGAKSKPVAKGKAASKSKSARKYNRRDPAEIAALRKGVIVALQGEGGAFVASSKIAATLTMSLGKKIAGEDIAAVIGYLREKGYVNKKGDKINATYGLTNLGKSFTGEFEVAPPEKKAPSKPAAKAKPAAEGEAKAPAAEPAPAAAE